MARKTKCTEDHRCAMCGGMLNCQDHQSVWGQILAVRTMGDKIKRRPIEELWMVWLDGDYDLIGSSVLSRGGVGRTAICPMNAARHACKQNASYAVMVHNHPDTTDPHLSDADFKAAADIRTALNALGVKLLDSVSIARNGAWCSTFAIHRMERIKRRKR